MKMMTRANYPSAYSNNLADILWRAALNCRTPHGEE